MNFFHYYFESEDQTGGVHCINAEGSLLLAEHLRGDDALGRAGRGASSTDGSSRL
jgi:hypothetical protein